MYKEVITNIDEGDIIAFYDDLPFELIDGLDSITQTQANSMNWFAVKKAQFSGSIIILEGTYLQSGQKETMRIADWLKVIVA
jgi:hypothetical protein